MSRPRREITSPKDRTAPTRPGATFVCGCARARVPTRAGVWVRVPDDTHPCAACAHTPRRRARGRARAHRSDSSFWFLGFSRLSPANDAMCSDSSVSESPPEDETSRARNRPRNAARWDDHGVRTSVVMCRGCATADARCVAMVGCCRADGTRGAVERGEGHGPRGEATTRSFNPWRCALYSQQGVAR